MRRTVEEYEAAGAQAIQLEDQLIPKKCGHTPGKQLVEASEMAGKLEAAVAARRSDRFQIIARTDAIAVTGFDDAIRRGELYQQAEPTSSSSRPRPAWIRSSGSALPFTNRS